MGYCIREEEVVVHPVDGMQLSCGYIRKSAPRHYVGNLPGMATLEGDSFDEVLRSMDRLAKAYYGDDVVVETVHLVAGI